LSVTDNAGDAVLLYVSASNERQKCGNKTGPKLRTKHETLKHHNVDVTLSIVVLFHRLPGYTFTFTSYFKSDITLKKQTKHPLQIIFYSRHTKIHMLENMKRHVSAQRRSKCNTKFILFKPTHALFLKHIHIHV
jgi:hypothetical protein